MFFSESREVKDKLLEIEVFLTEEASKLCRIESWRIEGEEEAILEIIAMVVVIYSVQCSEEREYEIGIGIGIGNEKVRLVRENWSVIY